MTLPAHRKVQHRTNMSDDHDKKLCHIQMLCPNQQMLRAGKPMIFGSFENLKDILLALLVNFRKTEYFQVKSHMNIFKLEQCWKIYIFKT